MNADEAPPKVALFMEDLPENPLEDPKDHPDLLAMKSLMEETPEEAAEWLKEQGNLELQKGKRHYKSTIEFYTRAIAEKSSNDNNNSIYYSNRSHVEYLCQNYRNSLIDAETAIRLNPNNVKAYFRASKSALAIGKLEISKQFCVNGLGLDADNLGLLKLQNSIDEKLEEEYAKSNQVKSALTRAQNLADAMLARKISMGPHAYKDMTLGKHAWLDESETLHWPILFLYCEFMTTDFIEDGSENDRLTDHVDIMFDEESTPLEWDKEKNYTKDKIEIYYQKFSVPILTKKEIIFSILENDVGDSFAKNVANTLIDDDKNENENENKTIYEEKKYVKVNTKNTLKKILSQNGNVIPGIPVFYVVAKGTKFRDLFLSGEWSLP